MSPVIDRVSSERQTLLRNRLRRIVKRKAQKRYTNNHMFNSWDLTQRHQGGTSRGLMGRRRDYFGADGFLMPSRDYGQPLKSVHGFVFECFIKVLIVR